MNHLGWSAPARRVDAGSALKGILAQHVQIRDLLERSQKVAECALTGDAVLSERVAPAIGDIRTTMEVHLAFEERLLIPLLRDDLPLGPERADRLLDEHHRQREMLAKIHTEATAMPLSPMLAVKLAALTDWLLDDMNEEERCLLIPEVVREDVVIIDQSGG